MPILTVPYSKNGMILDIPDENFSKILQSKAHDYVVNKTQEEIVEESMDNPIGSQKLEELVKNKKSIVIITHLYQPLIPAHKNSTRIYDTVIYSLGQLTIKSMIISTAKTSISYFLNLFPYVFRGLIVSISTHFVIKEFKYFPVIWQV